MTRKALAILPRLLLAALAGLVLLAAPALAGARDSGWPLYSNTEFGFSARFPGAPQAERSTDTVSGIPVTRVTVQYDLGDDSGLMLWATRFEGGFPDPEAALKGGADNIIATPNTTLVSRRRIEVQGVPAEVFVLSGVQGDYTLSAMLLVKDGVLYQLLAIGHGEPPKETAAFQQGFALLPSP